MLGRRRGKQSDDGGHKDSDGPAVPGRGKNDNQPASAPAADPIEFEMVTTRGGDRGESGLGDGSRRRKDDLQFELLGTLDELSANLGVVRAHLVAAGGTETAGRIEAVQRNLLTISGIAAFTPGSAPPEFHLKLPEGELEELEQWEHTVLEKTPLEPRFVVPGDTVLSAHIHVARTVCRRAERRMVGVIRERGHTDLIPAQRYINRLSDLLFVLAEHAARTAPA